MLIRGVRGGVKEEVLIRGMASLRVDVVAFTVRAWQKHDSKGGC